MKTIRIRKTRRADLTPVGRLRYGRSSFDKRHRYTSRRKPRDRYQPGHLYRSRLCFVRMGITTRLKSYKKKYPEFISTAGTLSAETRGTFWVRYIFTDRNNIIQQYRRPFLIIDREPDESPLLIGISRLRHIKVDIYLDNKEAVWAFKIMPKIKIDNRKRFTAQMKKTPKVYTLVLKNAAFNDISSPENGNTINRIPATL